MSIFKGDVSHKGFFERNDFAVGDNLSVSEINYLSAAVFSATYQGESITPSQVKDVPEIKGSLTVKEKDSGNLVVKSSNGQLRLSLTFRGGRDFESRKWRKTPAATAGLTKLEI